MNIIVTSDIKSKQKRHQLQNFCPPPFGMQIQERSYTSSDKGYRFGFNGMERDDEVKGEGNSLDFGARIYDSRLGSWLSIDPHFKTYPSLSPYGFVANNPILFIDPEGKDIVIYYKEKKGIARWFEKKKEYAYQVGIVYSGDNSFLMEATNALNYIVENGADWGDVIQTIATDKNVKVFVQKSSATYFDYKTTIWWNPNDGLEVMGEISEGTSGRQSPALGLFHEMVHAFHRKYLTKQQNKDIFKPTDDGYDMVREKIVIDEYESRAAEILQSKGYDESIRKNHRGGDLATISSTSTLKKKELKKMIKDRKSSETQFNTTR